MSLLKKYQKFRIPAAIALIAIMLFSMAGPSDNSIRSRVLKLSSSFGMCSGEQVRAPSGVDYVLTAAHCKPLADQNGDIRVTTEDGRELMRKIVAEDPMSDLLLLEGVPGIRGLDIANWDYAREHVRTFTHGNRFDTYKTEGVLIQDGKIMVMLDVIRSFQDEMACTQPKNAVVDIGFGLRVCLLSVVETATTAMIVPGSSGGPILNDSGQLIGVVSAGDGHFGYLVRLYDIKQFMHNY